MLIRIAFFLAFVPRLALAADAVGVVGGNFSVNEMGAAVYSIPIEVPPTSPLKTNLSLQFNSQAPNGDLGVGWRLSGLSEIHRCVVVQTKSDTFSRQSEGHRKTH